MRPGRFYLVLAGLLAVFCVGMSDRTAPSSAQVHDERSISRYQPTWLPDGLVERDRSVDFDQRTVSRTWLPPGTPDNAEAPQVRLVLSRSTTLDTATSQFPTTPVDVNGSAGVLATVRDSALRDYGEPPTAKARFLARVEWRPAPGDLLTISATGLPDTAATALRMARSVRPGGEVTVACPVGVTWLPAGTTLANITVTGTTPADWSCDIETSDTSDNPYPPELTVASTPVRLDPGDTRVTVRGTTVFVRAEGVVKVVPVTIMQLGRYGILLRSADPESVTVDVLKRLTIQPTPADIDWLGRR